MPVNPFQHKEEQDLLALLRQDNLAAFEEIYNRFWERLFVAANQVLEDEAASKDILQEIFIDLWNRRRTLDIRHLNAFLYQAVKFQIAKHLRRRPVNPIHLEVIGELKSAIQAEDHLLYLDLTQHLEKAIANLPPRCQEIFRLSRFEHLSNKEIATRLHLSLSTVENQINIALKALRANLDDALISVLLLLFLHQ